jgi:hypothetical protein
MVRLEYHKNVKDSKNNIDEKDADKWMTLNNFCERFPWPTRSALQAYISKEHELGLTEAFMRCGRRVLVKPKLFFKLVEENYHNGVHRKPFVKKCRMVKRAF